MGEVKLKGVVSREGLDEWAASKCVGDTADVANFHSVLAEIFVGVGLEVVCAGNFCDIEAAFKSLRDENGVSNLEIVAECAEHRTRGTLDLRPSLANELVTDVNWESTKIGEVNSNRLVGENMSEMLLEKTRLVFPGLDDPINLDSIHLLLCKLWDVECLFKSAETGND